MFDVLLERSGFGQFGGRKVGLVAVGLLANSDARHLEKLGPHAHPLLDTGLELLLLRRCSHQCHLTRRSQLNDLMRRSGPINLSRCVGLDLELRVLLNADLLNLPYSCLLVLQNLLNVHYSVLIDFFLLLNSTTSLNSLCRLNRSWLLRLHWSWLTAFGNETVLNDLCNVLATIHLLRVRNHLLFHRLLFPLC